MHFLSGKKIILLGIIVVLLATIPLTIYLIQKQQETRAGAVASTTLSFSPTSSQASPIQKAVGDTFDLDIMMDPGSNQVSFIELALTYNKDKLMVTGNELVPNANVLSTIAGPVSTPGNISITLSIGADPTKVIQTITKIATISFKALATTETTATQVQFGGTTQVLSRAPTDQYNENVLSTTSPAYIAIAAGTTTPTPTATSSPAPTTGNQLPICDNLNVDRTTSGTAPFSIAFTANGRDSDGTISKVSFNFGDGPVQDVTQAGGIGTNSVSVQIAHTYRNPGTFQASAIFTDNNNAVSTASSSCGQTITVTGGAGGPAPTSQVTVVPQPSSTPTATLTPTVIPLVTPTGPGHQVIAVGIAGVILTILGGFLFLAL